MPLSNTTTLTFIPNDFTSDSQAGADYVTAAFGSTTNVKWANKSRNINLGSTTYGYITLDVIVTGLNNVNLASITFPNSFLTPYATNLNGLFTPLLPGQFIKLNSGTNRIYAIVNYGDKLNPFFNINVGLAKKGGVPTSNVSVEIQFECTAPIYRYLAGMHVYSPYDSANTPTLTTYLYSITPSSSWTVGTNNVFSTPMFSQYAYPYYYNIGDSIFKIGTELERSYGINKYYEIVRYWLFGKTHIYDRQEGPKSWETTSGGLKFSEAFVFPTISKVNQITQVLAKSSISQPASYRYYMGYNGVDPQKAAQFFTTYDYTNQINRYISGFNHAYLKLAEGFVRGNPALGFSEGEESYQANQAAKFWISVFMSGVSLAFAIGNFVLAASSIGASVVRITSASTFNTTVIKEVVRVLADALSRGSFSSSVFVGGAPAAYAALSILGAALFVLAVVNIIILLTKDQRQNFKEPSNKLGYRYTDTPYINNGTRIYTNAGLTNYLSEHLCDGMYFYNQKDYNTAQEKQIAQTFNAIINQDPLTFGTAVSIAPDQPSLVTDLGKLLVLPYTSGKPDYTVSSVGVYKSAAVSTNVIPNKVGDLLNYPSVVGVSIPAGAVVSYTSQEDADNQAASLLNNLTLQS
jgi:hypothetical protein